MRLATVDQSRRIDELSQSAYGLSAEILMESAGALAARELEQSYFPELLGGGSVAVVCGPGHNGGDGLVLARHLYSSGRRNITIFLVEPDGALSDLVRQQRERCERQGLKVIPLTSQEGQLRGTLKKLSEAALIVDALFGIGLSRPVTGVFSKIIDALNRSRAPAVSLDCPSGLDCNTGQSLGGSVRASMTLSFGLAKPGFFVNEGPLLLGRLRVLSIGFPPKLLRELATTHFLFSEKLARRYLPRRKAASNKSHHGHLLVLAGREGYWGAGALSSAAAYRMGAGYVTWASFSSPSEQIREIPEVLTGSVEAQDLWERSFAAAVIGPGLGAGKATADLILRLQEWGGPVVVDADALTTCVEESLFPLPRHWVLTPHAGELSRILQVSPRSIEQQRFEAAMEASQRCGSHVLLKGFRSVLAFGDRCMVIQSGNSALAKAGTGDVLAGMIGGLMVQGLETLPAAATAAYVHGRMADDWVRSGRSRSSLLASDLKDHLPQLLGRIQGGRRGTLGPT